MSHDTLGVAIPGCGGQMGRALVQAVAAADDLWLAAASEAPGSPSVGQDAGPVAGLSPLGVTVTDDVDRLLEPAEAVIDFTLPDATLQLAPLCAHRRLPLVVGTTGLGTPGMTALREAALHIPVVFSPNMSVGVNVLLRLAEETARLLGPAFDLEIVEAHHSRKADAPSGTALALARALAAGSPEVGDLAHRMCHTRSGQIGPRPPGQIGIQTVRGGDVVGDHTVLFLGQGERVELTHRASSRQTFARGALRALRWVTQQPPGLYSMRDVLGLG